MVNNLTDGAIITENEKASEVMKARYTHGDEWQNYISDKFEEAGIPPVFYTINDGLSDRIADYQYEGNWIEAKTYINSAEVTKILTLYNTLAQKSIRMVIMCEWEKGSKKHAKNVKDLRTRGVIVFEGQSECDSFIINESVLLNPNKVIKMAEPISIPFDNLIPHPNNRDLNVKNIPTIKASVITNGFFTQINVVPHGLNEKGEMIYMIFEGHTRYFALKDLKEKGYIIPPVACINVPWVTSKEIDTLHKMLITTNTTYQGWKLKNYITSHKGNLVLLNDVSGIYTYGKMLQAMNQAKKEGWGEANPIYMFCHTDSLAFDDMKKVKDGSYRISEFEYDEQIRPILDFMKQLTFDKRKFNGTIMRDIIVDIRIMYNTNQTIKDNFANFLGYLKLKFVSDYSVGRFPETKETGQQYWGVIKHEYFGLINLGLAGIQNVKTYQPSKTIEDFA
jgi:hypothetical protein